MSHHQLLLDNLELIERLIRFVSRRHHLSAADAEELAAIVRLRLVEDDAAVLRKFQRRSTLSTYLTVVIERMYQDFRIERHGKWRPCAAARRAGEIAVLLEEMTSRDGMTFDEAAAVLETNHRVTESRERLREMFLAQPARGRRMAPRVLAADLLAAASAARAFSGCDDADEAERLSAALAAALETLSGEERRILQLRFQDNLTVAEIAREVSLESRVLYRRLHGIIRTLRASLEAQGIRPADVLALVGHPTMTLRSVLNDRSRS